MKNKILLLTFLLFTSTATLAKDKNSKWKTLIGTNPLNDSKMIELSLNADEGLSKWGKSVSLYLRCKDNKTQLYIKWNDYLGNKAKVTYRIGKKEAITENWILSTNSKATFYSGDTITLIENMMKSNSFITKATPYNANPIIAIFDTTGLKNTIKPLSDACNWQKSKKEHFEKIEREILEVLEPKKYKKLYGNTKYKCLDKGLSWKFSSNGKIECGTPK